MIFKITREQDKISVKEFIFKYTKISAKELSRLKKHENGILLNGLRVTVRATLCEGDTLSFATEAESKTSDNIEPVNMPVDIIYEDEHYIAINKPPFVPTHPSHNHHGDTLANALAYRYSEMGLPFVFRAANRLDKNTSGIVIFAKSAIAASCFSKLQQNKLVKKEYLALVSGKLEGEGIIKGYIRRKEKSVITREFSPTNDSGDAQYSLTEYQSLCATDKCSLVRLILHTGRTHQIRVHMANSRHYVIGDELYGRSEGENRQMLHAHKMEFVHPISELPITLTAPLPEDFIIAMQKRGINYEL